MTTVPKLWPGDTFAILGTGPSLSQGDVDAVRGRAHVIAINDAFQLAPWADVLYSSDQIWWRHREGVSSFVGLKFAIAPRKHHKDNPFPKHPGIQVVENTGPLGLERDPAGLRHGKNSGYAAINLAVHLGAARILLLGYNMGPIGRQLHFDGSPGIGAHYDKFGRAFGTLVAPLKLAGVDVVNCTTPTRLTWFRQASLRDALAWRQVAA